MKVIVDEKKFDFYAENSKLANKVKSGSEQEGIGLNNVRKRLELIYPNKYNLNITNLDSEFTVRLSIDY